MSEQLVFEDCGRDVKRSVSYYWSLKWPRLAKLLTTYRPDIRHLRVRMRSTGAGFDANLSLILPTGTLVAGCRSKSHREALDLAVDRLVLEMRRHKQHLHREDRRRNRVRAVA